MNLTGAVQADLIGTIYGNAIVVLSSLPPSLRATKPSRASSLETRLAKILQFDWIYIVWSGECAERRCDNLGLFC